MADIPEEHLTEELLDRLLSSTSIEQYLDEEPVTTHTLTDYLFERMEAHGLKRADVVRATGINATVVYDVFSGKSRPGRDHAIMLAFGLQCTLRETQRLLRLAGVSELWCKQRRDAIIIWCIRNGFDRISTDDELYRLGEPTLLQAD
ncbi:helix-turn-helix transcriptional regulator [Bifidobacterium longum]|uniref:helix-turn-helix domain-containing protein n=1 Tax=Bifidobacterium longum TaxID=216816 RepID=UPI001BA8C5A6|nr:helix-turn-helix transcriptional regulator [Bifidobacterium longum]QUI45237.1 helix-turn-helix transcriptional regulator [Bifidobacterium longum]QUI47246.1 helix-turn-helix transcriptional regulator [Bifidobacterium longum]